MSSPISFIHGGLYWRGRKPEESELAKVFPTIFGDSIRSREAFVIQWSANSSKYLGTIYKEPLAHLLRNVSSQNSIDKLTEEEMGDVQFCLLPIYLESSKSCMLAMKVIFSQEREKEVKMASVPWVPFWAATYIWAWSSTLFFDLQSLLLKKKIRILHLG